MAVIFLLSAQTSLEVGLGTLELIGRKLVHFGEYALLCLLLWRALEPGLGPRGAALVGLLLSSGYAATDELHQTFVEGRNGSPFDWLIDTSGAALMAFLLRSGLRRQTVA